MKLIEAIVQLAPDVEKIRRELHANPELSFEERGTAKLICAKLDEWAIPHYRGLASTGVVGVIRAGTSKRAIGLRADMDALPIVELNAFSHSSRSLGKMHACGHDGHVAMLLAAARHLSETRRFDGTVYLIFQPAEESGGGGQKMVEEGLFDRFPMDVVFAMHNWPGLPFGQFAVGPGVAMASSNEFELKIYGKGGHAALPHTTVDPILIASEIIQAFQTILTRSKKSTDPAVLSVTTIHAGDTPNVTPSTCVLGGTVRTFSSEVTNLIEARMTTVASQVCAAHGVNCDFCFRRIYPPTVNSAAEAQMMREVMEEVVGLENVLPQEAAMTSEDFSFMLEARPGAYAFVGNGDGEHREASHCLGPCTLHNPSYDFNDGLIPLGATVWARLAEQFLKAGVKDSSANPNS